MSVNRSFTEIAGDVRRAQGGDAEAMNRILEDVQDMVYYNCLRMLKSEPKAQDASQEILLAVYRNIGRLKDPIAYVGWVKKSTANYCRNQLCKVNKEFMLPDNEDGSDPFAAFEELDEQRIPDKALDNDETRRMIVELIDRLPDEQRMCVMLYYYDELKTREIADTLHVSEGTIKSRLNYARKAIKEGVKEYEKQGIKLYGLSPIPFLAYFLAKSAATISAPITAAGITGGAVAATATAATAATAAATTATTAAATGGFSAFLATTAGKVVAGVVIAAVLGGAAIGTTVAVTQSASTHVSADKKSAEEHIIDYLEETVYPDEQERAACLENESEYGPIAFLDADGKNEEFYYYFWMNLDEDEDCELLITAFSEQYLHSDRSEATYDDGYYYLALDWDSENKIVRERRLVCQFGEENIYPESMAVLNNGVIQIETYTALAKSLSDFTDDGSSRENWFRAEWYWSPFSDTVKNAMADFGDTDLVFVKMQGKKVECVGYSEDGRTETFHTKWDYYSPEVEALRKALPRGKTLAIERGYFRFSSLRRSIQEGTKRLRTAVGRETHVEIEEWEIIRLDANGGLCEGEPVFVSHGMSNMIWFQPIPTRAGYTFKGWYTAEQGGTLVYGGDLISRLYGNVYEMQGVTLYAHWE